MPEGTGKVSAAGKNPAHLGSMPVGRLICQNTIPAFVSILAYNLYNIADTFFIAKGVGMDAAGGLAVSFPLFIFLSAFTSMLGGGGASILSQALGAGDLRKANRVIANCFGVFFLIAVLISLFGLLFLEPFLYGMGVTDTLLPYAKTYTRIILSAAVVSTGFSSLIRAEGSSRYAMYIWLIPIGINLLADLILIFVFSMGVAGAAMGTALSWCVSMAMSVRYFFLSGRRIVKIEYQDFKPNLPLLKEILGIGIPTFIQTSGYSFSVIFINQILKNHGGDLAISTYGIVSKVYTFLLLGITALMQGIQPIIGYNYGEGNSERISETLHKSYRLAAFYGLAVFAVLLLSAESMIRIFTSDNAVIGLGRDILLTMGGGIVFHGIYSTQSVYFQATGKRGVSLFLSLCSHIICLIPSAMILLTFAGNTKIWYAFPLSGFASMVISCLLMKTMTKDR